MEFAKRNRNGRFIAKRNAFYRFSPKVPGNGWHDLSESSVWIMKTHKNADENGTQALLDATADATDDAIVEARNRLKAALDATTDAYARLRNKAVAGAKATDQAIRGNPYKALGIAIGVGALLGFLLSRRARD